VGAVCIGCETHGCTVQLNGSHCGKREISPASGLQDDEASGVASEAGVG
jgi:hypothetical protein